VTRHEPLDEDRLIELFGEIEAPAGVDSWRDRADVEPEGTDHEHELDPARVVIPMPERWLRPPRAHRRATAVVAAAVAAVVGMGGVLIVSQVLSDAPPADPTMNIDDPERTGAPTTSPVTSQTSQPPLTTLPPGTNGTAVQGGPNEGPENGEGDPTPPAGQPVWGPMNGYPAADNTGIPSGSTLTEHHGDLVIDTPGAVITDLRISGVVWVNAPDVTLRRVVIDAPGGTNAVEQQGARLRIQDSELTAVMGQAVAVNATGLTMIRNKISADDLAVSVPSDSFLLENYVTGAGFYVGGGASGLRVERNSFDQILMADYGSPITDVTIENNNLRQVGAPTDSASAGIHVIDNEFHGDAPSTGWKVDGPDWIWTGNTHRDTGEPVSP
jgi:hypothetical protein